MVRVYYGLSIDLQGIHYLKGITKSYEDVDCSQYLARASGANE